MKRLITLGACLSVALLVLCAVLWAHSGVGSLAVKWSLGGTNEYHARSDWGRVVLARVHHPHGEDLPRVISAEFINHGGYHGIAWGPPTGRASFFEIVDVLHGKVADGAAASPVRFTSAEGAAAAATYVRVTTYHPVLLPLLVLPAVPWIRRTTRAFVARRRIGSGKCGACGYDLRENPGRCPECGVVPPPAPENVAQQAATAAVERDPNGLQPERLSG